LNDSGGGASALAVEAEHRTLDEVELLRDVKTAEDQVASGLRSEQARVEARLRALLGR
jgi:hypothetical protein